MNILRVFSICFYLVAFSDPLYALDEEATVMSYTGRDIAGHLRWRADATITNERPGVYSMVEKAEGFYSSFKGRISWVARMEFERTKNNVRPMSLDKRVFNEEGDLIRVERQDFDLTNNTATCTHEEPGRNISRTKSFRFNKDVVTRLSLGLYAQKFLESGNTVKKVQMVSEEPNVYDVELRLLDKEVIDVNGRKVAAYRLGIDPFSGLLNIAEIFLPKAYAWHSAEPGYEWLRYTGLEGGVNSARVEVTVAGHDR